MKHVKLLLILSFTVILLFPLAAQKQFHYGLRVGGNMSTFWGIGGKDIQPKLGYNAGITADIDFDKNMYLLSGLFLFDRGGKYADNHPDAARRGQTIDLLYLRVPVHVAYKYYINPDLKHSFSQSVRMLHGEFMEKMPWIEMLLTTTIET